jgi:hypothetical protein
MKRREILAALIAIILVCTSSSLRAATVTLSIDGTSSGPLPTYVEDGVFIIGTPTSGGHTFTAGGPNGGTIHVSGALDPDPSIFFASGVTDTGAASTFGYSFVLPLAPQPTNPQSVQDSLAGGVTNGVGTGSVTIDALPPGALPVDADGITELMVYWLSDDGGTTWKNVGMDNGPDATIPAGSSVSTSYGFFNQGPLPAPAGSPWTHMRVDLNFGVSGGGDKFNFTGSAILVPEPGALILALLGMASAFAMRRSSIR